MPVRRQGAPPWEIRRARLLRATCGLVAGGDVSISPSSSVGSLQQSSCRNQGSVALRYGRWPISILQGAEPVSSRHYSVRSCGGIKHLNDLAYSRIRRSKRDLNPQIKRSTEITSAHMAISIPHMKATSSCSLIFRCFMNMCVSDSILPWYSRYPLPASEQ